VLQLVEIRRYRIWQFPIGQCRDPSPQAGVRSMHFLFRSEAHLIKAIADPKVSEAVKAMIAETVQGARVNRAVDARPSHHVFPGANQKRRRHERPQGARCRLRPPRTLCVPAYGAQIVHMPVGSVYTSLQTGVIDVAENGVNVYLANKHYEVAPVLSMTEHEANNSLVWVSDKVWIGLTPETAEMGAGGPPTRSTRASPQGDRARASITGQAEIRWA